MSNLRRLAPTPVAFLLTTAFAILVGIVATGAPAHAERAEPRATTPAAAPLVAAKQREAEPLDAIEATFRLEIGEAKLTLHDGARPR